MESSIRSNKISLIEDRICEDLGEETSPKAVEFFRKSHYYGGLFTFSGSKSCYDYGGKCDGWDGISSRCECGHRRVRWVFENNFLSKQAY